MSDVMLAESEESRSSGSEEDSEDEYEEGLLDTGGLEEGDTASASVHMNEGECELDFKAHFPNSLGLLSFRYQDDRCGENQAPMPARHLQQDDSLCLRRDTEHASASFPTRYFSVGVQIDQGIKSRL